jgi:molybdopterin molybdotransferase
MLGSMAWLGLPGNPVSAMVTFELFGRPLVRRQLGHARIFRPAIDVRAGDDITLAAPLTHFFRAVVVWGPDGATASLTGPQGSGLLTSMARANALLVVPPERAAVQRGDLLRALLLGENGYSSATFNI